MKEDSIEEALKKLSTGKKIKMYELLRTFKKEGIENFVITRKKYVDVILSDYKRVLKENEILKKEKEQPWEEWNNLEQGSYETEQKLKQQIKELQKENEELKISNKEIDKECSRLEKKEVELINENEHYEDLIYALKTYYNITREDLEKCMKNDR